MIRSVLVVDDEPGTRYLMRLLLEEEGFEVFESTYGIEAFHTMRDKQPDLMIFDVDQNDMSGFAICRTDEPTAKTTLPIVLLTAKTHLTVFTEVLRGAFMRYLPKPVTAPDLSKIFSDLFHGGETAVSQFGD